MDKGFKEIIGSFSKKKYSEDEAIHILDPMQAALYWANGVEPLDIFSTRNRSNNKAMICYVFRRSETKELFDLWCKHELT